MNTKTQRHKKRTIMNVLNKISVPLCLCVHDINYKHLSLQKIKLIIAL